ncbi:hypothetical protein BJ741DRAFT_633200 [Chytriomyces cf. hyalinus JEL632]|nr:hypothetical protein BJ741DRAFT_633200 [Chytriomyces cf. hyalinus JEL632]
MRWLCSAGPALARVYVSDCGLAVAVAVACARQTQSKYCCNFGAVTIPSFSSIPRRQGQQKQPWPLGINKSCTISISGPFMA